MEDFKIFVASEKRSRPAVIASYLRAVERFRYFSSKPIEADSNIFDRELALSALIESVMWIRNIFENESFLELCEISNDLFEAFSFARNELIHNWRDLVSLEIIPGRNTHGWIWQPQIANSDIGTQMNEFNSLLGGKIVISTLDEMAWELWKHRGWEIHKENIEQPVIGIGSPLPIKEMLEEY